MDAENVWQKFASVNKALAQNSMGSLYNPKLAIWGPEAEQSVCASLPDFYVYDAKIWYTPVPQFLDPPLRLYRSSNYKSLHSAQAFVKTGSFTQHRTDDDDYGMKITHHTHCVHSVSINLHAVCAQPQLRNKSER